MPRRPVLYLLLIGMLIGLVVWLRPSDRSASPPPPLPPGEPATGEPVPSPAATPAGDALLAGHGDPDADPRLDVEKLGRVIENFLLQLKTLDARHTATNRQIADLLRGNNPHKLRFVSPNHAVFGPDGELMDRWGTPYWVHPLTKGVFELRSAGPDRTLFTADDLHRLPGGGFLEGADLNPRSLFPPTP